MIKVQSILLCLLIGYGCGLFQTAYIYGKIMKHKDIRSMGSGNSGTTNALRSFGTKAGVIVFAGDFLKTILAIVICRALFAGGDPCLIKLIGLWAGLGVVLGHNYPFYMGFHGGKGIACTAAVTVMFSLFVTLIGAVIFILCFVITQYVSLGSLMGSLSVLISAVIMGAVGYFGFTPLQYVEMILVLACIVALAFYQHRKNIHRLLNGTERRTTLGKKRGKA